MTTKTNHQHDYARLRELAGQGGESTYEMIVLADRLLSNREWVSAKEWGGGDESLAIDRLEELCFGHLSGALTLPQMLELYKAVQEYSVWKAKRFHLKRMFEEMKARERARTESAAFDRPRGPCEAGTSRRTFASSARGSDGAAQPAPRLETDNVIAKLRDELRKKDEVIALLREENVKLRRAVKNLQKAVADINVGVA